MTPKDHQEEGFSNGSPHAANLIKSMERMKSLGEADIEFEDSMQEMQSVSQILKNRIIKRAPDKMIDYLDGYILISYRNHIVYMDVCEYVNGSSPEDSAKVNEKKIENSKLAFVDMDSSYKIISMQQVGLSDMTTLVLEHLETRQIRFLRIDTPVAIEGSTKKKLRLLQMGAINPSYLQPSKLLKYRSIAKTDKQTGQRYQVCVVVR